MTLVGPGGIGKTRLAIEVAAKEQGKFIDGVCMVNLAALNSAAFLTSAIAEALGILFQGQSNPESQLKNSLQQKTSTVCSNHHILSLYIFDVSTCTPATLQRFLQEGGRYSSEEVMPLSYPT